MTKYTWFVSIILALHLGVASATARMDASTHDLMIAKLESVLDSMPKKGPEFQNVSLRLADLYADRARLKLLAQQDATPDRKLALNRYKTVFKQLKLDVQGPVTLQMAHLYTQLDDSRSAEQLLKTVLAKRGYAKEVVAKAHAQLGEIEFKSARFSQAERHFSQSLKIDRDQQAAFITYRLSWALFNQGKYEKALLSLKGLISNSELTTDSSFHEDLTRDLVTFIARTAVGEAEVKYVANSSPENMRKENLHDLANELERLGKKSSATLAWKAFNLEGDSAPKEELESQIRVAQLQWDLGAKDKALLEYQKATKMWSERGCTAENCEEIKKRFKNFVTTWNRVEKDQPSPACLAAYSAYLTTFSTDAEMHFKAATVAEQVKNFSEAQRLFGLAADIAFKNSPQQTELVNASLEREISNSELSRNPKEQLLAYDHYLALLPNGEDSLKVMYQKAHAYQSLQKNEEAFQIFDQLALTNPIKDRATQMKAADLSLDILAQLKKDEDVFQKSESYSKIYSERKVEYARIHQQAALKLAAAALSQRDASDSIQRHELERLQQIDTRNMSQSDIVAHYKAQIALAERIQDLGSIEATCLKITKISGLSANDREYAESRLIWVAELKMDFSKALQLTKKSSTPQLDKFQRQLRLATLAELAGQNAEPFYKSALNQTKDRQKQIAIRVTLIRMSQSPWSTLREQGQKMIGEKKLLKNLVLEIYAKTGDRTQALMTMNRLQAKNTDLIQLFNEESILQKWKSADIRISRLKMNSRSDSLMQHSIKQRLNAIREVEKIGKTAIQNNSWLAQLAVLNTLSREQSRLYRELIDLPAPKRLSDKDKKRYLLLVERTAAPFKVNSEKSEKKAEQFLETSKNLDRLEGLVKRTQGQVQKLVISNIRAVGISRLNTIAEQRNDIPSSSELVSLQSEVKKDPFDLRRLEKLKDLSEKRGSYTLAAYLEGRLAQLKKRVQ